MYNYDGTDKGTMGNVQSDEKTVTQDRYTYMHVHKIVIDFDGVHF